MKWFRTLTPLCVLALAATCSQAQFYKLHNADIGGSAIGQFTTPVTINNPAIVQNTSDTFGGEFTLRDHPVAWAGIELNYAYTEFNETYSFTGNGINSTSYTNKIRTDAHEATAGYLFHPHFRKLQPFVTIGGGSIDFVAQPVGHDQWRGTGLVELGFDIPTSNPHMGFRVQGRSLIYRAPNFSQPLLASKSWVVTDEPSFGAWYRF
jgi:hypothetical protein